MSLVQAFVLAQPHGLHQGFAGGLLGVGGFDLCEHLTGFFRPALLGEQVGSAAGQFDPIGVGGYLSQPLLSLGQLALALRHLCERHQGLCQTSLCLFVLAGLGQLHMLAQFLFGLGQFPGFLQQQTMHQPTIGKAGVLRIQASELLQGFGLLWQTDQVPGIAQPQLRLRGPFHGLGQQGGHLGRCRVGQAQRQDQGARGRGVCRAALACGFYRQRQLPGFAPHAAHGGPGGGRGAALFQGCGQGFFNRVSGGFFVLHPGKHPGHRRNGRILLSRWKLPDRHAQGLASLVHPVQSQQNLQDVAVGFGVFGNSAFPSLRRLQSRLARARLQSQVNGTLEQSWITGFASRVQNDRETTARRAAAHIQLAHQQLVKQRRIEHRLWW